MQKDLSIPLSGWSTPDTSFETVGRPSPAPQRPLAERPRERCELQGMGRGPTGAPISARSECTLNVNRGAKTYCRPPPLALHPPLTTSPLKRNIDQVQQDDRRSVQTAAGYIQDLGDVSATDFCMCEPPSSAKRTPRPRNSFILYRQASAHILAMKNPGIRVPDTSKIVADSWNALSDAEKQTWRDRADEVKRKHQEDYPDYRYQPRRNGRRNSNTESPTAASFSRCSKCGKYPMINPKTPLKGESSQPTIPGTPPSASFTFGSRQLPPMQAPPLGSPRREDSHRHYSNDIHIPPINLNTNSRDRESIVSPESKRKRFSNGSIGNVLVPSPQQPLPHNVSSPNRGSVAFPKSLPQYVHPPRPPMPPPVQASQSHIPSQLERSSPAFAPPQSQVLPLAQKRGSSIASRQHNDMLTLPKDQQEGKGMEEILKGGSVREQLKVLGMVSQPLRESKHSHFKIRGAAIAVEGDNLNAVQHVAEFLERQLSRRGDFSVRLAQGPRAPPQDRDATIQDYRDLASIWHNKGQELIKYMTDPPRRENMDCMALGKAAPIEVDAQLLPVVIFNRYSHFASIKWASRVPLEGMYESKNNWLWFATQWRGIVGPDFTIYIRDVGAEFLSQNANVEVCKEIRTIFVLRDKDENESKPVDDRTLRRLEFEVSEYIGDVSHMDESTEA